MEDLETPISLTCFWTVGYNRITWRKSQQPLRDHVNATQELSRGWNKPFSCKPTIHADRDASCQLFFFFQICQHISENHSASPVTWRKIIWKLYEHKHLIKNIISKQSHHQGCLKFKCICIHWPHWPLDETRAFPENTSKLPSIIPSTDQLLN